MTDAAQHPPSHMVESPLTTFGKGRSIEESMGFFVYLIDWSTLLFLGDRRLTASCCCRGEIPFFRVFWGQLAEGTSEICCAKQRSAGKTLKLEHFQTWNICKPPDLQRHLYPVTIIRFFHWDDWAETNPESRGESKERCFLPVWSHLSFLDIWGAGVGLQASLRLRPSRPPDCASSDRRRLSGLRCWRGETWGGRPTATQLRTHTHKKNTHHLFLIAHVPSSLRQHEEANGSPSSAQ